MSSLAASRADNFYIDPNRFDPNKRGRRSYNELANSHPLGKRAKKLKTEGILVVRFELPNDVWCTKCNEHVSRGVRFNAEKKEVGMYFTTKIWEFTMPCPLCKNIFTVRTNPSQRKYDYVNGCEQILKNNVGIVLGDTVADEVVAEPQSADNVLKDHDIDDETVEEEEEEEEEEESNNDNNDDDTRAVSNRSHSNTVQSSSSSSTTTGNKSQAIVLPVIPPSSSSSTSNGIISKLENKKLDELRSLNEHQRLQALYNKGTEHYGKDRIIINSLARKINRDDRKEFQALQEESKWIGLPSNIVLTKTTPEDIYEAEVRIKGCKNKYHNTDNNEYTALSMKKTVDQLRNPDNQSKPFFISSQTMTTTIINNGNDSTEGENNNFQRTPSQEIFHQTLQGASAISNTVYSKVMSSSIFPSNTETKKDNKQRIIPLDTTTTKNTVLLPNISSSSSSLTSKESLVPLLLPVVKYSRTNHQPLKDEQGNKSVSKSVTPTIASVPTLTDIIRQGLVSSSSSSSSSSHHNLPSKKIEAKQYILQQIQSASAHHHSHIRTPASQQGPQMGSLGTTTTSTKSILKGFETPSSTRINFLNDEEGKKKKNSPSINIPIKKK